MNTPTLHLDRATGLRMSVGFGVVLALAASTDEASAATLGSLATSMGLFAAFVAFLVLQGWPVHLDVGALSTAGGLLALAVGAILLWRVRQADTTPDSTSSMRVRSPGGVSQQPDGADIVLPAGVDRALLLIDLRQHFVRLQAAWDIADHEAMRAMTTPDMLEELRAELPCCAVDSNYTEVVTLHARLLAFDDLAGADVVSVDFSGLIRESADLGAAPFRELWMLTRSKNDSSGWRLARHQALL